jgi:hypothetical protein
MKSFKVTAAQINKIAKTMTKGLKASGPVLSTAIKDVATTLSAERAQEIASWKVLKEAINEVNAANKKAFISGDARALAKMWDIFPVGMEGHSRIRELMTHKDARAKNSGVIWSQYVGDHKANLKRAKASINYSTALINAYI